MNSTAALLAAISFAAARHSGQVRKNGGPYINHPIAVAEILARIADVSDSDVLQAAVLHDILEDTPTSVEELKDCFGSRVSSVVQEVTDCMSLPKAERKQLQVKAAPQLSPAAKLIRIADKICNIGDLSPTQPADWTRDQKIQYLDWAERVVNACRGTNLALDDHFRTLLNQQRAALGSAG